MIENINVDTLEKLSTPKELKNMLKIKKFDFREDIINILNNVDKRFIVIIGPCSIHNTSEALDYAKKLSKLRKKYLDKLFIIMRVYFEKPRTTVGWKGLINDPDLDDSCNINKGLYISRKLMINISNLDLPIGCEFLDTISPEYICDLVSWGAIGARTTESQCHRQLASGLSMPIGFKNTTSGSIKIAIDAIKSGKNCHTFLGINEDGNASIIKTNGNDNCHIILRGGNGKTNYDEESIISTYEEMEKNGVKPNIIVDCSHGNSNKDYRNQPKVVRNIIEQLKKSRKYIKGIMIESNIFEGNQKISDNMKYGVSVTDSCISFENSELLLDELYNSL